MNLITKLQLTMALMQGVVSLFGNIFDQFDAIANDERFTDEEREQLKTGTLAARQRLRELI